MSPCVLCDREQAEQGPEALPEPALPEVVARPRAAADHPGQPVPPRRALWVPPPLPHPSPPPPLPVTSSLFMVLPPPLPVAVFSISPVRRSFSSLLRFGFTHFCLWLQRFYLFLCLHICLRPHGTLFVRRDWARRDYLMKPDYFSPTRARFHRAALGRADSFTPPWNHRDGFHHPSMDVWVRVRTVMENLKKSRNFKMVISRPGKVMEKT